MSATLRHDSGLAASPLVLDILRVERQGYSPFARPVVSLLLAAHYNQQTLLYSPALDVTCCADWICGLPKA